MKKAVFLLVFTSLLAVCVDAASVTVSWNNDAQQNLFDSDGSTFLTGSQSDGSTGFFAQLIYAGADGLIDSLDRGSTTGVTGDDVVLAVSHVGRNMGFDPVDGNINASSVVDVEVGQVIYARFFNAASPNFGSSLIPTEFNGGGLSGTLYGNSNTYTIVQGDVDTQVATFVVGSVITNVIPEPSTFMSVLIAGGTVLFAMRRRYRK